MVTLHKLKILHLNVKLLVVLLMPAILAVYVVCQVINAIVDHKNVHFVNLDTSLIKMENVKHVQLTNQAAMLLEQALKNVLISVQFVNLLMILTVNATNAYLDIIYLLIKRLVIHAKLDVKFVMMIKDVLVAHNHTLYTNNNVLNVIFNMVIIAIFVIHLV